MDNPLTMPFKLVPIPGEVRGPTKSALLGEMEMLAPESQMSEKVDSFLHCVLKLAGCLEGHFETGRSQCHFGGNTLQSACKLQSSVDAVFTYALWSILAALAWRVVKFLLPMFWWPEAGIGQYDGLPQPFELQPFLQPLISPFQPFPELRGLLGLEARNKPRQ
jgi:hypothetical protein